MRGGSLSLLLKDVIITENTSSAPVVSMTEDEIRRILEKDKRGVIKNSIHNCITAMSSDPDLYGHFRLNLLTEKIDIKGDLPWDCDSSSMDDTQMRYLLWYLEKVYSLNNEKKILSALKIVSYANRYHPIQYYLTSLRWDGEDRMRHALHHFLGCEESDYNYEALKLFMMGALERIYCPGCKFEHMLCLVGGQGAGKSTFFRLMALRDEWFSDDLRKLDDENIYRKLQGHWIIEMSEMIATASAKSIEEIKSFLSRQKETYKVPYEIYPADRPRQCIFGGTTNRQDFLPRDRTGNRRFIPVTVHPEEAEVHILEDEKASRAYIEQLWAQAFIIYIKGDYTLTFSGESDGTLSEHQQDFMQEDTLAGQIYAFLDDFTGSKVCSKMLYHEALGNINPPAAWETREICEIMNTGIQNGTIQGWQAYENVKRYGKYGHQRGWERIEEPLTTDNSVNASVNEFVELPYDDDDLPFD